MTTLMIKDLSIAADLDDKAMNAIRGGCGYCSTGWQMPKSPAAPSNFSFDASQMIGQSQNVVNNNGNNAAFVSGITSTVSPIQQANNNINF